MAFSSLALAIFAQSIIFGAAYDETVQCVQVESGYQFGTLASIGCAAGWTLMGCGSLKYNNIAGSYIENNICYVPNDGNWAILNARCCKFPDDVSITLTKNAGPNTGLTSSASCSNSDSTLISCDISSTPGKIKSVYTGNYGSAQNTNGNLIDTSNTCHATAYSGTIQTTAVCATLTSKENIKNYTLTCNERSKYSRYSGAGACPAGYFGTGCGADYPTAQDSDQINRLYPYQASTCFSGTGQNKWLVISTLCCKLQSVVTRPTNGPTFNPTTTPTVSTKNPTNVPTKPTVNPSKKPTNTPTKTTLGPTTATTNPTNAPTMATVSPTGNPSRTPTEATNNPTKKTTKGPTLSPTRKPTYDESVECVQVESGYQYGTLASIGCAAGWTVMGCGSSKYNNIAGSYIENNICYVPNDGNWAILRARCCKFPDDVSITFTKNAGPNTGLTSSASCSNSNSTLISCDISSTPGKIKSVYTGNYGSAQNTNGNLIDTSNTCHATAYSGTIQTTAVCATLTSKENIKKYTLTCNERSKYSRYSGAGACPAGYFGTGCGADYPNAQDSDQINRLYPYQSSTCFSGTGQNMWLVISTLCCKLQSVLTRPTNAPTLNPTITPTVSTKNPTNLPTRVTKTPTTGSPTSVTKSPTDPCKPIVSDDWKLVRHVPLSYKPWHPATDNLIGTDIYGNYSDNILAPPFSIKFNNIEFNQFLFTNIDCSLWLIAGKNQVYGDYDGQKRWMCKSNQNNYAYQAVWYSRLNVFPEDPWISVLDHPTNVVYGENNVEGHYHKGANVYIRQVNKTNSIGCEITASPTNSPSLAPTTPTKNPTNMTDHPTKMPTKTQSPTSNPTKTPTLNPSNNPTKIPTISTVNPSNNPSKSPTNELNASQANTFLFVHYINVLFALIFVCLVN